MSKNNNEWKHTAHFLVSKFLNSNESLEIKLSANDCHVLRYLADLMDMTNYSTGISQCKIALKQAELFSRIPSRTIQRSISSLLKKGLLIDIARGHGLKGVYSLGASLERCATMAHVQPVDNPEMRHHGALDAPNNQKDAPPWRASNKASNNSSKKEQPSIFEPDEESIQLAKECGLDLEKELSRFIEIKKKARQTQYEFRAWLKEGHNYKLRMDAKKEVRPSLMEYGPGHPRWEYYHGTRQ